MDEKITAYLNQYLEIINNYLDSIKTEVDKQPIGCLVSGGIDSSIIASLANKYFPNLTLLSFGTNDSHDLPFLKIFGNHLNKKISFLEINSQLVEKNFPLVEKIFDKNKLEKSTTQLSLGLGYFLIFQFASNLGIKNILTGQGPDILFAGYNKYKKICLENINQEIEKDLVLLETDKKRDSTMASYFDIKLFNPYLQENFVEFSKTVPANLKLIKTESKTIEKYISRKVGERIGLPSAIVNRPKKAFQYSTKVQKLLLSNLQK